MHWLVTGIAPDATGAAEGVGPSPGTPRRNGYDERGWGGPRPPVGDPAHRYFFRLYAFARPPEISDGSAAADLRATLEEHATATGTVVGRFAR